MSERAALLAAICARPADDTARLVFADWLDEHGDTPGPTGRAGSSGGAGPGSDAARAEFIRLQIETARLAPHDPRVREIESRTAHLLGNRRTEWEGPVRELLPDARLEFRRGFVDSIVTEARSYLPHARDLCTETPLSRIELVYCEEFVCSLNRLARETPARLYAVANRDTHDYRTTIALLPQAPAALEPELQTGAWLVWAWAVGVSGGRGILQWVTAERMYAALLGAQQNFDVRFAMRPYASRDEFETWFPGAPEVDGPVWLRLKNGKPVDHSTDFAPPDPLRAVWG